MAYVTLHPSGTWEVRESHVTPAGPRSRTLATFDELDDEVISRARARATEPLAAETIRAAARRAGAHVAPPAPDRAAAELVAGLEAGRSPRPGLRRLLEEALAGPPDPATSNARAAAAWIPASPRERGDALRDLLELTDRLPAQRRAKRRRAPRLDSSSGR
jgi:hypothetical protein